MLACSQSMVIAKGTGVHPHPASTFPNSGRYFSAHRKWIWMEQTHITQHWPPVHSECLSTLKSIHNFPGCLCAAILEHSIEKRDHRFLEKSWIGRSFPAGFPLNDSLY